MGDAGSGGCSPSGPPVDLTMKVAGVHWWYRTRSHAAELTAGEGGGRFRVPAAWEAAAQLQAGCLPAAGPTRMASTPPLAAARRAAALPAYCAAAGWPPRPMYRMYRRTAGYFNTDQRDGYRDILELCAVRGEG